MQFCHVLLQLSIILLFEFMCILYDKIMKLKNSIESLIKNYFQQSVI